MTDPITEDTQDRTGRTMAVTLLIVFVGCGAAIAAFLGAKRYMQAHHFGFWWGMGAAAVYGVAIIAVAYLAARIGRRISREACSPVKRRYQRRVMAAATVYVFGLIAAIGANVQLHPTGALAYAVALAPALPVVGMIVAMGLYMREETDEFQRAVHAEGALWATGGLLSVATVWGFLEMFGLAAHVEVWWAFPVWAVLLGVGQLIARRRYR